ncbi:hypothetical protein BC831DRAFT_459144 [Entophlyctis helioformis]|nr:hypothetical protein BC831DRAFT_459144 [Entophlyctis helioformis]
MQESDDDDDDDDDDDGEDAEAGDGDEDSGSEGSDRRARSGHDGNSLAASGSESGARLTRAGTRTSRSSSRLAAAHPDSQQDQAGEQSGAEEDDQAQTSDAFKDMTKIIRDLIHRTMTADSQPVDMRQRKGKHSRPSQNQAKERVIFVQLVNDRIYCPVLGCHKHFSHNAGLKYHLQVAFHDMTQFLNLAYMDQGLGKATSQSEQAPTAQGNAQPSATAEPTTDGSQNPLSPRSDDAHPEEHPEASSVARDYIPPDVRRLAQEIPAEDYPISINDIAMLVPGLTFSKQFPMLFAPMSLLTAKTSSNPETKKFKPRLSAVVTASTPSGDMIASHPLPPVPWVDPASICLSPSIADWTLVAPSDASGYLHNKSSLDIHLKHKSTKHHVKLEPYTAAYVAAPGRKRMLLNTGCSVWAIKWCPNVPDGHVYQYLAVAGYSSMDQHHIVGNCQSPAAPNDPSMRGVIQIWRVPLKPDDRGNVPVMEMAIAHDRGRVFSLDWCSSGLYDASCEIERLGVLAACFGDGSSVILNIPVPSSLRAALNSQQQAQCSESPLTLRIRKPLANISLQDVLLHRVAWASRDRLAVGPHLYHRHHHALQSGNFDADRDVVCGFQAHDSAIWDITWCTLDGRPPRYMFSSGHDGNVYMHDILDPWVSTSIARSRTFAIPLSLSLSSFGNIFFGDSEFEARMQRFLFEPGEANSKTSSNKCMNAHTACIWDVDASQRFPFVASGGADGMLLFVNHTKPDRRKSMVLYQVTYNPGSQALVFDDHVRPALPPKGKRGYGQDVLTAPQIGIQQVCWSPSRMGAQWLASGGAMGWVRIDACFGLAG